MPSLRERKKEAVRKNILTVASKVFYIQGYEHATIAEIAKQANTGVGTCYNYFPSKAHLFCESVLFVREDSWAEELARIQEKGLNNPVDVFMELICYVSDSIRSIKKPLLREFFLGISEMYIHKSEDLSVFFLTFLERRRQIVEACKQQGLLPADMDTKETITCIFSIIIVQITFYAVHDDMTIEQMHQSIRNKLALFFQGKTPATKEGEACQTHCISD